MEIPFDIEPIELELPTMGSVDTEQPALVQNSPEQIKASVEKLLREAEKSKAFKDTTERKAGTRKELNAIKLVTSQVLDDLEQDHVLARKLVIKQKIWEGIDIEKERQSGTSAGAAFLKVKLYNALAKQPFDSADARKAYVGFIELYRYGLESCKTVDGIVLMNRLFYEYETLKPFIGDLAAPFSTNSRTILRVYSGYEPSAARKKLKGIIGASLYAYIGESSDASSGNIKQAKLYETFTEQQHSDYIERRRKALTENIDKLKAELPGYEKWTDEQYIHAYKQRFIVSAERIKYLMSTPDTKQILINNVNGTTKIAALEAGLKALEADDIPEPFKVRGDDWSWTQAKPKDTAAKEGDARPDETLIINTKPPLSHIYRVGGIKTPKILAGDIEGKYTEYLGIKSVQFGNSMPDAEREANANFTFASFADLEEVLDLSVRKLNRISALGMDFGTRGRAGSAATYWSDYKVINLNRATGDGTLAHEWAHYLDNALNNGRGDVMKINGHEGRWASMGHAADCNVQVIMEKWRTAAKKRTTPKMVKVYFAASSKKKIASYYFKDTVEDTINAFRGKRGFGVYELENHSVLAQVYGAIAAHFGLHHIHVELETWATDFLIKSRIMDGDKTKRYWSSNVEMFARSFEEYVLDRFDELGIKNNYLQSPTKWAKAYGVYPEGEEKAAINAVFDELFAQLRKNGFERDGAFSAFKERMLTEQKHEGIAEEKPETKPEPAPAPAKPSLLLAVAKANAIAIKLKLGEGMGVLDATNVVTPNKGVKASQTQAIQDVLGQKKWKDVNQKVASILLKAFKNDLNAEYETTSDFEMAFLDKTEFDLVEEIGNTKTSASYSAIFKVYKLTDRGKDLVTAISARYQSLFHTKKGFDMFPEDITGENIESNVLNLAKAKAKAIAIKLKLNAKQAA